MLYDHVPTVEDVSSYAQRRADATGTPYGVWRHKDDPELLYSAPMLSPNPKVYRDLGADLLYVARPVHR